MRQNELHNDINSDNQYSYMNDFLEEVPKKLHHDHDPTMGDLIRNPTQEIVRQEPEKQEGRGFAKGVFNKLKSALKRSKPEDSPSPISEKSLSKSRSRRPRRKQGEYDCKVTLTPCATLQDNDDNADNSQQKLVGSQALKSSHSCQSFVAFMDILATVEEMEDHGELGDEDEDRKASGRDLGCRRRASLPEITIRKDQLQQLMAASLASALALEKDDDHLGESEGVLEPDELLGRI